MQNALLKRFWKKLVNDPPSCPKCAAKLKVPQSFPPEGVDYQIPCPACGQKFALGEVAHSDRGDYGVEAFTAADLQEPSSTKIKHTVREDGTQMWLLPKTGKSSLGCFAYLWCGFVLIFSCVWIPAWLFGDDAQGLERLVAFFPIPFMAVGWWLMRTHIREAKSDHLIEIGADSLTMTRRTRGKLGNPKVIPRGEVESVDLAVFYSVNYQPIHGVEVKSKGDKIRFGASLEQNEKRWIVASLRAALGMSLGAGDSAYEEVLADPNTSSLNELGEYESKKLKMRRISDRSFRASLKVSGGWVIALVGVIFVVVATFMGYQFFTESSFDFGEQDAIETVFNLIFGSVTGIMSLGFGVIGGGLAYAGYRMSSLSHDLEFSDGGISWKTTHFGRMKRERFRLEQISDLDSKRSGHSNNEPRYEVSIKIDGKKRKILQWAKPEDASALEAWVKLWMRLQKID